MDLLSMAFKPGDVVILLDDRILRFIPSTTQSMPTSNPKLGAKGVITQPATWQGWYYVRFEGSDEEFVCLHHELSLLNPRVVGQGNTVDTYIGKPIC